MNCSEALVWICSTCGHSFHEDEWKEQGRLCPACNAPEGSWHCGKCHAGFSQPFLGSAHPCLAQTTHGKPVRLVSKSQSLLPRPPKAVVSTPPVLASVPTGDPNSSRSIYGWPAFVILLIGAGLGLLFSGGLGQKDAQHLSAKDTSSAPQPSLSPNGAKKVPIEPKPIDSAFADDNPSTTNHQEVTKNEAVNPDAAVAASRLAPVPAAVKPTPVSSPPLPKPQEQILIKQKDDHESVAKPVTSSSDSSSDLPVPPDVFRDRHTPESGIPPNQNAYFAPEETAFGRYQRKLYLAIGSRWNQKVQQTMAELGVERVILNFHVMPDGTISDLKVTQGNPNSVLAVLSKDAIEQSGGLIGPFPADLLKDKPNGFPWQLAFRIY
jgi:hypothetical protein